MGEVIDTLHTAWIRFNDAPTEGFGDDVGTKTTLRIQNNLCVTLLLPCPPAWSLMPSLSLFLFGTSSSVLPSLHRLQEKIHVSPHLTVILFLLSHNFLARPSLRGTFYGDPLSECAASGTVASMRGRRRCAPHTPRCRHTALAPFEGLQNHSRLVRIPSTRLAGQAGGLG